MPPPAHLRFTRLSVRAWRLGAMTSFRWRRLRASRSRIIPTTSHPPAGGAPPTCKDRSLSSSSARGGVWTRHCSTLRVRSGGGRSGVPTSRWVVVWVWVGGWGGGEGGGWGQEITSLFSCSGCRP